jgi:hypothetical protein
MRKALFTGAAVLFVALAGCSKKVEPVTATPEMEAEQRRAEQEVREAEVSNQKESKLRQETPTPADGELEERAEYERRKKEGK